MDYDIITSRDKFQYIFGNKEERIGSLFGNREEYYRDIAQTFYNYPESPSIWKTKVNLH